MLSANAVVVAAGVAMVGLVAFGHGRGMSRPTILIRCALICAVALIVSVTLFPLSVDARLWKLHHLFSDMHLEPFGTIRTQLAFGLEYSEARQLIGNVALFVPLGFLLPAAVRTCRRVWVTLAVAASLSVLIEIVQALLPNHTTDVDDVILNSTGAALGYFAFRLIAWALRQRTAPLKRTLRGSAPSSAA
jgi:glycopeptide antibiotics resistance protein